jgi:hypothetical protein
MSTRTRTWSHLTASGAVCASRGRLAGFYINSTNVGTLILKDGGSSGTAITGTITPAVGWNSLPVDFETSLYATIAGSALDVTFCLE